MTQKRLRHTDAIVRPSVSQVGDRPRCPPAMLVPAAPSNGNGFSSAPRENFRPTETRPNSFLDSPREVHDCWNTQSRRVRGVEPSQRYTGAPDTVEDSCRCELWRGEALLYRRDLRAILRSEEH